MLSLSSKQMNSSTNYNYIMTEIEKADVKSKSRLPRLSLLTFHYRAVGDKVHLSQGCRHAKRSNDSFKNGLLFSNRPVSVQERIRLRIEANSASWDGTMRVGLTSVPPDSRSLPLPSMAIPDLNDTHGHWVAPMHEEFCKAGSEFEFWVSRSGRLYVSNQSVRKHKLLDEVTLSQPVWAVFDLYGQTCAITLLGSEKRLMCFTMRSRLSLPSSVSDTNSMTSDDFSHRNQLLLTTEGGEEATCVVCLGEKPIISLPCGHCCLCRACAIRVFESFGTCPLCRQSMDSPPMFRKLATSRMELPSES
ncbi:E3 ubiquitin-protein ligase NEURL3-like isoform X2 [Syngnathus typhle]|uniref:E3 ubiquitin-protein ligase NEURL3-like isoform X2 n=1 Tax=Syngnathus typhle TaxID=161592 RepID=UPI002A69C91B|nr:E3 ubiquitin-protein ligase NEURL3-like isoform X2 [Syngnathus typhle]